MLRAISINIVLDTIKKGLQKESNLESVEKLGLEVSNVLKKYGADVGTLICGYVEQAILDRLSKSLEKLKLTSDSIRKKNIIIDAFDELKKFCPIGAAPNIRNTLSTNSFISLNDELQMICDSAMEKLFDRAKLADLYGLSIVRDKDALNKMIFIREKIEHIE